MGNEILHTCQVPAPKVRLLPTSTPFPPCPDERRLFILLFILLQWCGGRYRDGYNPLSRPNHCRSRSLPNLQQRRGTRLRYMLLSHKPQRSRLVHATTVRTHIPQGVPGAVDGSEDGMPDVQGASSGGIIHAMRFFVTNTVTKPLYAPSPSPPP